MGHSLHWTIGPKDPRVGRTEDLREARIALIGAIVVPLMFWAALYPFLEMEERRTLFIIVLALWLLVLLAWVGFRLTVKEVGFEVMTLVDLPPDWTSDRMEQALKSGAPSYRRRDRIPWLHAQQAVFKVNMDYLMTAYVVVEHQDQPREAPSWIIVRATNRRDDWWDLRILIEETFQDVGAPDGWAEAVTLPGYDRGS